MVLPAPVELSHVCNKARIFEWWDEEKYRRANYHKPKRGSLLPDFFPFSSLPSLYIRRIVACAFEIYLIPATYFKYRKAIVNQSFNVEW
jgi:hypothetical protein